jgi:hypothetical protein
VSKNLFWAVLAAGERSGVIVMTPSNGHALRLWIVVAAMRFLFLAVCLGGFIVGRPALAIEDGDGQGGPLRFDIPAQPLAQALDAYSEITGREVFCDGALVLGRRSAGVSGVFLADEALLILLRGTDFVPRVTGKRSFTITRSLQAPADLPGPMAMPGGSGDDRRYFAAVQAAFRRAFCTVPETPSGGYQLVVKVWTAPTGEVLRSEISGSTGRSDRDRAFSAALRTLRIDEPPPPAMPQPLTMVVFPRSSGETDECGALVGERASP